MTGKNVNDFIDTIFNITVQHCGLPKSRFNQKKLLEYISMLSNKEYEAYSNQINFAKKAVNETSPTDMDLLVKLYEMFKNRSEYFSKNF